MRICIQIFIIIISLLIFPFSKIKAQDFKLPIIVDTLIVAETEISSFIPNSKVSFERIPFYIGEIRDTIDLGRFYQDVTIPIKEHFIKENALEDFRKNHDSSIIFHFYQEEIVIYKHYNELNNVEYFHSNILIIQNISDSNLIIGYGYQIPIIIEALDENKNWIKIEKFHYYECGVGLHYIQMKDKEIACFVIPKYHGNYKTLLRFKLGNNFSKPFEGEINHSLLYK